MTPALNIILRGLDPEVVAWRAAILRNGGSVGAHAVREVNRFVRGCRSDGLWNAIIDMGVFVGVDNLNAALVKLKTAPGVSRTLVNTNYVSGDYTATGASAGLVGDGSSKYLDTSVSILSLNKADFSIGAYITVTGNIVSSGIIGSSYTATGDTNRFYIARVGSDIQASIGNVFLAYSSSTAGFYAMETSGTTIYRRIRNGTVESTVSSWNNNGFQAGTVRLPKPPILGNDRISLYFIGRNLNHSAFSGRVKALMAAFGCNVY